MRKQGSYKNVKFEVSRRVKGDGGRYIIDATYKGEEITTSTDDTELWDWLDDDSDAEKNRRARRNAYFYIRNASNR